MSRWRVEGSGGWRQQNERHQHVSHTNISRPRRNQVCAAAAGRAEGGWMGGARRHAREMRILSTPAPSNCRTVKWATGMSRLTLCCARRPLRARHGRGAAGEGRKSWTSVSISVARRPAGRWRCSGAQENHQRRSHHEHCDVLIADKPFQKLWLPLADEARQRQRDVKHRQPNAVSLPSNAESDILWLPREHGWRASLRRTAARR